MHLNEYALLPAEPGRHFSALAALFTSVETEPTTEASLLEWYNRQKADGIHFTVAVTPQDRVLGFDGMYRENLNREQLYGIYVIVEPDFRGCGLGSVLYDDLITHAQALNAKTLRARIKDDSEECLRFAVQRGFVIKKQSVEMMFDLNTWDDLRYDPILQSVRAQGFHLTNMAELGDTLENRHKLYELNSTASATDPGSDGIPPWSSFEEFNKFVCSSYWYHPDAQIIAIDTHTGEWAAMSAITVFDGSDHAYNLFTGTAVSYRGRKLAQAVKALALRKARTFGVSMVRTSHNSENAVMIGIDKKLGYIRTPGTYVMEKELISG